MADDHIESDTSDVVVVGGGGAGLAAAVSAASRGMKTVLLEKRAELGGTTCLSVGSLSAACTQLQRRAGIADRPDDFRQDMEAFSGDLVARDNPALRAMLAAEAGITVRWLEQCGVVFAGPFPEPPHRVNRMHNVIPGSRAYVKKLARAARRSDVKVALRACITDLVADAYGRVIGVEYSQDEVRRRLWSRRGVILATGDFSGNKEMRKTYLSAAAYAAFPVNSHSTGDGHRIATRVGAATRNMDFVFGPQLRFPRSPKTGFTERLPEWTWLSRLGAQFFMHAPRWMMKPLVKSLLIAHMSPTDDLFRAGAILVDLDGNRLDTATPAISLAGARDAKGYIILDEHLAELFTGYPHYISTAPGIAYAYFDDYLRGRPDIAYVTDTLDSLAGAIGVPADRLRVATQSLQGNRFFALGPVQAMLTTTEGSLAVDEQCRVLKEDRQPVEGLYAAGGVGQGGMLFRGHGLHIAWALTSGRIAGEMVARRMPVEHFEASVA